jgi:hypothetical protein
MNLPSHRILAGALTALTLVGTSPAHAQSTQAPIMTFSSVPARIYHCIVDVDVAYDAFVASFEKLIGRYDPAALSAATTRGREGLLEQFRAMEGEENLVLFQVYRMGSMSALFGTPRKGMRFNVGNPTYAARMVAKDVRAGLYAPLSILVYETEAGKTRIEYELPSSVFGQLDNPQVDEIARPLDGKLERAFEKAARLAR